MLPNAIELWQLDFMHREEKRKTSQYLNFSKLSASHKLQPFTKAPIIAKFGSRRYEDMLKGWFFPMPVHEFKKA